jgi:hypothetical protein
MSGEVMQGSNTEVINFSKHGAKIQGVEYQSFDDFIEKIEKVSITPSLDNSALPFIDKKARAQMLLKLFKRLERSNYKFSKACELAIKELEMQKDLSKSFKKMIHILRGNSVLGHTFKYDLEAFNMQSRLLDLGAPSKAVTLRFLSSMKRNSDGLAKELTISISKLKTVPNKKT